MRESAFQNQDRFVSDRAFWVGAIVYFALCLGAVAAFGNTFSEKGLEIIGQTNNSGSLIFVDDPLTNFAADRFDFFMEGHAYRGALTFNGRSLASLRMKPQWSKPDRVMVNSNIGSLPEAPSNTSNATGTTYFPGANDSGITASQIALGEQTGFVSDSIAPVPEPATWLAAALAVGVIVWILRGHMTAGSLIK